MGCESGYFSLSYMALYEVTHILSEIKGNFGVEI